MKKKITLIAVLLAVTTLAAAPIVHARPGGHGRHGIGARPGPFGILGHLRHAKEELALTDQQTDQLKAIFTETHQQNGQYREQMRGSFKSVREVLLANPNDIAGAQAILDQQAATQRIVKLNLLNATSKAMAVLTADQRAKLKTLMDERQERRERRGR